MSTLLLLAASILTIITSILSVQIPRYLEHRAAEEAEQKSDTQRVTIEPPTRKPWDPPLQKPRKHTEKKEHWLGLPPTLSRHKDVQTDGTDEDEKVKEDGEEHDADEEVQDVGTIRPLIWNVVAVLACALLVCLFALLIAHSLASFIVYKTEARLGEARRGITQGGEMRLCLCARG